MCTWTDEECQTPAPRLATALSHRVRALYKCATVLPLYNLCSVIAAQDIMDVQGAIAFSKFRVLYYARL